MKVFLAAVLLTLALPASARNIAGCPDDKDLMWCLKLHANSQFITDAAGNPVALRKNAAMLEYEKRLHNKEH
jgi:hypothetical protein